MSLTDAAKSPWGNSKRKRGSQFPIKREAVLAAAAALMRRKGYEGASLAELAEILNITKPTLYYYVGSKEELYAEIIGRSQSETLDFMRSVAVAPEMTGFEKLETIMLKYVELTNSDFGACLMLTAPPNMDMALARQIKARTREGNTLIYQVLAQGQKDGTLNVADPTVVLHALFGSLNWVNRWFKASGRLSLRKVAELQVKALLDGVRGTASASPAAAGRRRPGV